jgi:hypothetical protein
MNYDFKLNKNYIIYPLIMIMIIPLVGIKFIISFFGNILLLLFLIPLLLLLIFSLGLYSYKSKVNICSSCGSISFGLSDACMNCGTKIENKSEKPSDSIIEVKAEEIK